MSTNTDNSLAGKVAVITGAASGIGFALAVEAARHGMRVVLADLSEEALAIARATVKAQGVEAISVPTDVSKPEQLVALRDLTKAELGTPWLIANNAGITKIALTWKHTEADWRRMYEINVGGVINGLSVFLPLLQETGSGYIVNTASAAGLLTIPASAAYVASKHAVVGLTETLYRELKVTYPGIGVSVLCPALVKTNILGSKIDARGNKSSAIDSTHALSPENVAEQVFAAIAKRQFWILTHAEQMAPFIRARYEQMISQTNPDVTSADPDAARAATQTTGVDFSKPLILF